MSLFMTTKSSKILEFLVPMFYLQTWQPIRKISIFHPFGNEGFVINNKIIESQKAWWLLKSIAIAL